MALWLLWPKLQCFKKLRGGGPAAEKKKKAKGGQRGTEVNNFRGIVISVGHGDTDRIHVIRKRSILRGREKGTRGKGSRGSCTRVTDR